MSAADLAKAMAAFKEQVGELVSGELNTLLERLKPVDPRLGDALRPYMLETSGNIIVELGEAGSTLQDAGRDVARSQLKRQGQILEEKLETSRKASTVEKQNLENHLMAEHAAQLREYTSLVDLGDARKAKALIEELRAQIAGSDARFEEMAQRVASAEEGRAELDAKVAQLEVDLAEQTKAGSDAIAELETIKDLHQYEMDQVEARSARVLGALSEAASEAEDAATRQSEPALKEAVAALSKRLRAEEADAEATGQRESSDEQLQRLLAQLGGLKTRQEGLEGELAALRAEAAARESAARMGEDEVVALRLDMNETKRQLSQALQTLGIKIEENRSLSEYAQQLVFSFKEERAELHAALEEADSRVRVDKEVVRLKAEIAEVDAILEGVLPQAEAAPAPDEAPTGPPPLSPTPEPEQFDLPRDPFPRSKSAFKSRRTSSDLLDRMMAEEDAPPTTVSRARKLAEKHLAQTAALRTSLTQLLATTETLAQLEKAQDNASSRIDSLRENARRERVLLVQTALTSLSQLRSHLTTTLSGMALVDVRPEGGGTDADAVALAAGATPASGLLGDKAESHWERWKREWTVQPSPRSELLTLRYTPPVSVKSVALSPRGARYSKSYPEEYASRPATAPHSTGRALLGSSGLGGGLGGGREDRSASPGRRPRTSGGVDRGRSGHSAAYRDPIVQMSSIPMSAPVTPRQPGGNGAAGGAFGKPSSPFPAIKAANLSHTHTGFGSALPPGGGGLTMRDLQQGAVSRPVSAAPGRQLPPSVAVAQANSSPAPAPASAVAASQPNYLCVHG